MAKARARLPDAAQVHRGQRTHEPTTAISASWPLQRRDRRRRRTAHAGGHRHRHGQHVVDQQRAGHGQPGRLAEVDGGDLVVAAAAGVGVHVLPVGRDHGRASRARRRGRPTATTRTARDAGQGQGRARSRRARRPPTTARREAKTGSAIRLGSSVSAEPVAAERPADAAARLTASVSVSTHAMLGDSVLRRSRADGAAGPPAP